MFDSTIVKKDLSSEICELALLFKEKGPDKFFTDSELTKYFNGKSYGRLAARYLAKQIILEHIDLEEKYKEIAIIDDKYGRPFAEYSGDTAAAIALTQELTGIHLSLSHSKKFASAFVVFEYFYPVKKHA